MLVVTLADGRGKSIALDRAEVSSESLQRVRKIAPVDLVVEGKFGRRDRFEALSWLSELRPLQGLEVRAATIPSIPADVVAEVERLGLAGALMDPIDFHDAVGLKSLGVSRVGDIGNCLEFGRLEFLRIERFAEQDLHVLTPGEGLRSVFINAKAQVLQGDWMPTLPHLETLTLLNVNAGDLGALVKLEALEVLTIATPSRGDGWVVDVACLAELRNLRTIVITGGARVVGVAQLAALPRLASISLSRGTFNPAEAQSLPLAG